MALIIGIIFTLSLTTAWYVTPVPKASPLILSDLENLDFISTMEGTVKGFAVEGLYHEENLSIRIEAHVYAITNYTIRLQNTTAINLTNPICTQWRTVSETDILSDKKYHLQNWKDIDKDEKLSSSDQINLNKTEPAPVGPRWYDVQEVWKYGAFCNIIARPRTGDNIILSIDSNIIRVDTNETLTDFSGSSTYVFNKLTRENVPDAPEADKPREGYDPFYPSHIKLGEDISNAWLDNLNETGTLEFVRAVEMEDVELYEYFVNKVIITKKVVIPPLYYDNYTLTSTKTVLIEPLSGLPVYTKNETFIIVGNKSLSYKGKTWMESKTLVYVTYKDKEMDLATPRLAHGAMQVLEFDKEVKGWILGAIIVILTVAFIVNTGSLSRTRKRLTKAKT